jgi:pimeloyl-ACP methyl ester carboxylesterase
MIAEPLVDRGFRTISVSRFGYLRTPLPSNATAEAQADALACLLDALGIERAAIVGVSAGGPSTIHFCLRHADRCAAMVLVVPLAYGGKPAERRERVSPAAAFLIDHTLKSDFLFWASSRVARTAMVESILGTPIADVRAASSDEQRRIYSMLDLVLPVSVRSEGLRNELLVAQALRPLPLAQISAPSFIASVEDCRYGTWGPARYIAERIPGARFYGFQRGGHMWVGHEAELNAEVVKFLESVSASVP